MKTLNKAKLGWSMALLLLCGLAPPLHAAPGTLSDSPLFLSTSVKPNIYWTVDDSGSMDWEILVEDEEGGIPSIDGESNYYILPADNNLYDGRWYYEDTAPSESGLTGSWKLRNHNYNVLYYNPEITYNPWAGADAAGNPMFSNADPAAAYNDVANPGDGTINLTQDITYVYERTGWGWWGTYISDTFYPARYYTWTDTDGDGEVEDSDTHDVVEIKAAVATYTGGIDRSDCASAPTCTYAEEIQNFANWYQFYRKREYVAKAAMGNIIQSNTSSFMGMGVFNDGHLVDVVDMSVAATKIPFLEYTYDFECQMASTPGRYAMRETGRYFEGTDGFTSPILSAANGGSCQQNFNIFLTDGFWNGNSPGVGDTDGDNDTEYDGGVYAHTSQNTLADVAMHYYERDLSALSDLVPTTPGVDEADHQHLVTYGVAFGVKGSLDPETQDPSDPGFAWTDPTVDGSPDSYKIDDLWHAAYNGRGLYLNAQNPQELVSSMEAALSNIDDRQGSAAAVAFNTNTLTTGSSVFLVLFNSNRWSGHVYKYGLDPITGAVSTTIDWEASAVLDARDLTADPRIILTHNGTDGTPFKWTNLTSAQKDDFRTNPAGGTDNDTKAEARFDYIRGDRTNERAGYNFRTRSSRLGDIVHSNPVYVGPPSMSWPSSTPFPVLDTYGDWQDLSAVKNRTPVLYVGANDGMMHGFRASDGKEIFAYVPSNLFSTATTEGLHYLADPAYLHRYYVDLPPTVTDAYVKVDPAGAAAWRTLLIGGQRAGGKALFAIDITYPTNFTDANAANLVLWEFTESDLGHTYSEPTVALMNNGKWAVIFGNGYNDSGSGEAQLFIVYLEGGLDGTWTSGTDYIKITTSSGSAGDRNGLSTPAVIDTNDDGTADRVYAGDLYGDLWAFDISDTSDSNWDVAYKRGSTPKPVYDGLSTQPITVEPIVANHPTVSGTSPNYMVYFGTGQYLVDGDKTSTDSQTFYGIWDVGIKELVRTNLVQQTFESGFASNVRVLSDNDVPYTATGGSKRYGWYIDLPASTERVVVNPAMRGEIVYFNTLISSSDPCTYGGSGWLMGVDMLTGGRPDPSNVIFDVNEDGVVDNSDLLTNDGGAITNAAAGGIQYAEGIPAESAFLGDYQYTPGTNTDAGDDIKVNKIQDLGDSETGRLSWEEISLD
ncbi:MAG: hypothetical protein D6B28_00090 [Gammaproteobacteria bacterium]|nr:MAG: hypothetical protein D6B28_00090 [Gammaproteobacteria bacterium]